MRKKGLNLFICLLMLFTIASNSLTLAEQPKLNMKGSIAVAYDIETGELIFTENLDEVTYPASITKLMTAILLAENKNKTDMLTYTESAAIQPAYSYGKNVEMVLVGDEMTASDAMDALILYSGNDIAYMIADNVAGNVDNFVKMMNDKAKELGMTSTNFVTPNGLDNNGANHVSTAYDLAKLAEAAYENDWVRETMAKKTSTVRTLRSIPREITNRNKNVGIDGCIGGKTGFTEKAGRCLAAIYERDGRTLIGVVMKSENNFEDTVVFEDMNTLMDYAFSAERNLVYGKNEELKKLEVEYNLLPFIGPKKTIEIPVTVAEDIMLYDNNIEPTLDFKFNEDLNLWRVKESTPIGELTITQKDFEKKLELYSSFTPMELIKANFIIYLAIFIGLIIVIALITKLILTLKNNNRRKNTFNRRRRNRW